MKVLFLVQDEQRIILDRLYDAVAAECDCDVRRLGRKDQANLRRYFAREIDVSAYDRILMFLRFKQEIRQANFISTLPNVVILEHDAYQNYIPSKYIGRFSSHYRKMPWVRVLVSGKGIARRLHEEGFDACFVPKGYDGQAMRDLGGVRDIELGFLGSTKSDAYSGRRALLETLAEREQLTMARTQSGDDYLHMLNRIRFFVSADMGMGEYMIKNFEAMACGCVLLAYDHGVEETEAIGFLDMQNVVLYRSVDELCEKLSVLRTDAKVAQQIADRGRRMAESRYRFEQIGQMIFEAVKPPLRPQPRAAIAVRLAAWLGR
ncbi:glycosyltransferase [Stutzerimonas xanthomarina]|uniref:glycosyltransferase n=1 Tax=Stutzerimonas xanthomarina TaxID=271420 RepID=UPI0029AF4C6B|nr:glycosyltransferase [Stutzerimonas xanthomarina]MDX2353594.1 glycosyltransferase [Stutzerimonas xanthomarina]|tara:strand:+ start:6346 stop:7302 length:957 start_codon:yes stop_codon:yes gene_type:complete